MGLLMIMLSRLSSNDLTATKKNIIKAQGKVYDPQLRQEIII